MRPDTRCVNRMFLFFFIHFLFVFGLFFSFFQFNNKLLQRLINNKSRDLDTRQSDRQDKTLNMATNMNFTLSNDLFHDSLTAHERKSTMFCHLFATTRIAIWLVKFICLNTSDYRYRCAIGLPPFYSNFISVYFNLHISHPLNH